MFNPKDDTVHTINPSTKKTTSSAYADAERAADRAEMGIYNFANKAGRQVRDFLHNANEEVAHTKDRVSAQIRSKPLQSGVVALAAGVVLGMLLRSRRY